MIILVSVLLFVIGAMMGSFACCQVWRIKKGDKSKRSHCMHCKYQLKWYDNVPIISWLCLGGRCRKCHKAIGCTEILSELGLALVYVLSFIFWPHRDLLLAGDGFELARFVVFLILMLSLSISFIYDWRWQELPVLSLYINIAIAVVFAALGVWQSCAVEGFSWSLLGGLALDMLGAFLVLPGLYLLMYLVSHERWVGDGDWILNIALALMLGNFFTGLFAMFAANILGCIVYLPASLRKKDLNMRIPFGPFLIVGAWLVFLAQDWVLSLLAL